MPRIRTLKPEFWGDEKLAPLSPTVRLVFLGLISMADDAGRLVDNMKSIDGMLFPETEDTARDAIETLARVGRILRYHSDSGQRLIQIVNWSKHQKVDNAAKYTLPGPTSGSADSATTSTQSRETQARTAREPIENQSTVSRSDLLPTTNDQRPTRPTRSARDEYPPEFVRAFDAMPKRLGGQPKKPAFRAWQASVRRGADPGEIEAGARRYAAQMQALGKVGTEFVKQAATFFGPDEHWKEPWEIPASNGRKAPDIVQYDDPKKPGFVGLIDGVPSPMMQRITA